ncbi:MAG: sulfurtransferase [Gammaproteobacteria bacterium]|nr:sulfurtransferase [Gammaproteobacteria bacterium]
MTEKLLYTPGEVMELMKTRKVLLIDIRDKDDYAERHIQGAVNVPDIFYYLSETSPEGLERMHAHFRGQLSEIGLTPDTTAIVYEDAYDSRYGGSCRGYWLLRYLGHERTGVLDGGFGAWLDEGLPADADAVATTPTEFVVRPQPHMLATRDEVLRCLKDPGVKLLDIRDRIEWVAKSSSPYGVDFAPRKGRLPGARWMEWYQFLERDGQIPYFKSPDKIRALCAEYGLYPEDDIIIYCFKGARASNTYVALKEAGFQRVRNYFGSWNEWSRDPGLPANEEVFD